MGDSDQQFAAINCGSIDFVAPTRFRTRISLGWASVRECHPIASGSGWEPRGRANRRIRARDCSGPGSGVPFLCGLTGLRLPRRRKGSRCSGDGRSRLAS